MVKSPENINVHVTEAPRKWIFPLREIEIEKLIISLFYFPAIPSIP